MFGDDVKLSTSADIFISIVLLLFSFFRLGFLKTIDSSCQCGSSYSSRLSASFLGTWLIRSSYFTWNCRSVPNNFYVLITNLLIPFRCLRHTAHKWCLRRNNVTAVKLQIWLLISKQCLSSQENKQLMIKCKKIWACFLSLAKFLAVYLKTMHLKGAACKEMNSLGFI